MLLTAGERISMALLAMAIADPGHRRGRSPAARPASSPTRPTARPRSSTSPPAASARPSTRATSRSWPASRGSRRTPRRSPRSAAAAPTPPRWRWPPRSRPMSARSTPTSTASSPPTRASSPPPAARQSPTRRCWRWPRAARRCCTCAASSTPGATACRSTSARRSASSRHRSSATASRTAPGGRTMEQAIISGVAHDRSEAKITLVGVPHRVGEAAAIFSALADAEINLDMIVQNVSAAARACTDISFTLPRADGQTAMTALAAPRPSRVRRTALRRPHRQGLLDRCGHALAPRRRRQVLRRAGRGRRQHRDDLHLRDPHLGRRRRGRRRRRRPATHTAFDLDASEVEAVVYGGTGR